MIRENTIDILLRIGIPAGVKGMTYISDAIELFDTDPYYPDGKMSSLYADIAKKRGTTATRVERAIRHAFETALTKGNPEVLEKYLDVANTQNSNLLKSLYFRIGQQRARRKEMRLEEIHQEQANQDVSAGAQMQNTHPCSPETCTVRNCEIRKQIYQEAMETFFGEMEYVLAKQMESVNPGAMQEYLARSILR